MKLRLLCLTAALCSGCQMFSSVENARDNEVDVALQTPVQDPVTREVFIPLLPAMTFQRSEPHLTANGKDYLHLIPIQTSQNGYRVVYLWVGTSSSIDRGVTNTSPPDTVPDLRTGTALQLRLRSREHPGTDEVTLPLVSWDSGKLLTEFVDMPVTTHERTALGAEGLRALVRQNPSHIVLVGADGQQKQYEHKSGEWY